LRGKRKNVLLALCGMSPAVITETVYALRRREAPVRLGEVVVITTSAGKASLVSALFDSGLWARMRRELGMDKDEALFGPTDCSIRQIPKAARDVNAPDVVSAADCEQAGDFILETLRQFTENPDLNVIFSLAGGRKTMSAQAALAMAMLGRRQDMLCHVLAEPPFDDPRLTPKFFYPSPSIAHYLTSAGENVAASDRTITLTELPFPRLRYLFEKDLSRLPGTYSGMVSFANQEIGASAKPTLSFDPKRTLFVVDGQEVKLKPAHFVLCWMLGMRRVKGLPDITGQDTLMEVFQVFAQRISQKVMPEIVNHGHFESLGSKDNIRKAVSDLNKALKAQLSAEAFAHCRVGPARGVYAFSGEIAIGACPEPFT